MTLLLDATAKPLASVHLKHRGSSNRVPCPMIPRHQTCPAPCARMGNSTITHAASGTPPYSTKSTAWPQIAGPRASTAKWRPSMVAATAATDASSASSSGSDSSQPLQVTLRMATSPAELRAAACLRAYAFYTYPEGRSEFTARSHRRMKADAEWAALCDKTAGKDEAYKNVRVECWVATIPDDSHNPVVQQAVQDMELSAKLPADPAQGQPLASLVVATLDVNIGRNLPAEELQGKLPTASEGDPSTQRAYLSNVCVAKAARRRGLAAQLIEAALDGARAAGVAHMYVHVVHDNDAALQLYQQAGFCVESQESEGFARAASRPRRLILHRALG